MLGVGCGRVGVVFWVWHGRSRGMHAEGFRPHGGFDFGLADDVDGLEAIVAFEVAVAADDGGVAIATSMGGAVVESAGVEKGRGALS